MPLPSETKVPSARTLNFYRGTILILLLATGGLGWALQRTLDRLPSPQRPANALTNAPASPRPASAQTPPAPPRATVVDIAARLEAMAKDAGAIADLSETYYSSPQSSVHMHVMGFRQRCPLHLHNGTHEATAIVGGTVEVLQVAREGGRPRSRKERYSTGAVIASPPGCGHEFVNVASDALLGNLVFATPPFDGNHYVTDTDPRLQDGVAPFAARPADELRQLADKGLPHRIVPVPGFAQRLDLVLVRTELELPAPAAGPTLAYVLAGEGRLDAPGGGPMRTRQLVFVPPTVRLAIHAAAAAPLALLVFRPEQPAK
jgi:quercetin dioxygenase-like cupin family protein